MTRHTILVLAGGFALLGIRLLTGRFVKPRGTGHPSANRIELEGSAAASIRACNREVGTGDALGDWNMGATHSGSASPETDCSRSRFRRCTACRRRNSI